MSRKLQVNLPQPSADMLRDLATAADEPPSRLASKLLQRAIALQARRTNPAAAPSIPPLPASTQPEAHNASPPAADTDAGANARAGGAPSSGPDTPASPESPARPPWLEPPGGDSTWRAITWGAIAALYARYPNQLQALQEDWWQDSHRLEHLAAIAHWRRQIDEGATDPREEIYFQETIDRFSDQLSRQPGSTGTRWDPNAIPAGWSSPRSSAPA